MVMMKKRGDAMPTEMTTRITKEVTIKKRMKTIMKIRVRTNSLIKDCLVMIIDLPFYFKTQ
jgi:hypothetical protein